MALIIDPDFLNQNVEVVFDTTNKTIELVKTGNLSDDGVTLQCLYSFCKEEWSTDDNLIKFPFPILAITEEKFELINGWDFKNDTTKKLIRTGGWALNPSGTILEEYACIITLGNVNNGQVYYQQSTSSNPVNFVLSGAVNQAIKIYGDSSHGNINYRNYLKVFCREYGYTYAMSELSDIGVTTMTYQVYRFPLATALDLKIIADDNTVDTQAPYTGMSINWYTSPQSRQIGQNSYDFHVVINGNNGTAEQIYTFVQRQLRKNVDIDGNNGGKIGKVTPQLLRFVGDNLYCLQWVTNEGTYIDNHKEIDRTRLYFITDTGVLVQFPYAAILTINFGENLVNDDDAIFRVYFANDDDGDNTGRDYGTDDAILVDTTKKWTTVYRSRNNNIATLTFSENHSLNVGDCIKISNVGGTGYNGLFIVNTIPDTNKITYTCVGSNESQTDDTNGIVIQQMGGKVLHQNSIQYSYDFDYNIQRGNSSAGKNAPIVTVAIGLSTAQFVLATGTIQRSLSNVVTLVSALERNYKNS